MLEQKIELLEEQVRLLTIELETFRKKEMFEKITDENLSHHKMPDVVNKNILQEVKLLLKQSNWDQYYTQYMDIQKEIGVQSSDSNKIVDNCFNVILKSILPDDFYWVWYFWELNQTQLDYNKLSKLRNKSKYFLQEMVEKNELDDRDMLFVINQMNEQQCKIINRNNILMNAVYDRIKAMVFMIMDLRNMIKQTQETIHVYQMMHSDVWEKEQYLIIYEYITKLKTEGKFTFEKMFGLTRKDANSKDTDYTFPLDAFDRPE